MIMKWNLKFILFLFLLNLFEYIVGYVYISNNVTINVYSQKDR